MGAREHVDAVDLVQPEPLDGAAQMPLVDGGRSRLREALRRERDAPRKGEGDSLWRHERDGGIAALPSTRAEEGTRLLCLTAARRRRSRGQAVSSIRLPSGSRTIAS